jgi:hypothetical protein
MPTTVNSHYQDPETGETILLPQLFPHAITTEAMTDIEIKNWLTSGDIPKELYEAEIQSVKTMVEIRERLERGELVQASELPSNPAALTDYLLKNKARLYGENVLKKIFSHLRGSDPDIVWLSFVKEAITCLATQDPSPIHFSAARKVLKEKYSIEDNHAVDLLVRALVDSCHQLLKFKAFQHRVFSKPQIDPKDLYNHLESEKDQMLQLDAEFIAYLKKTGRAGKKLAKQDEKECKDLFKSYKDSNYSPEQRRGVWGLWIADSELINVVLMRLGQALWEDQCAHIWKRKAEGHPSLAKPITEKLITILAPNKTKKFTEKEGNIICYDQKGEPLLIAPAVDINMISAFQKGVKELSTLTGHKMLRWQVNTGFERWRDGDKDPRLIEIDGGYSRIAELVGCKSSQEISRIRNILHVQAHGNFIFPDGSHGNMLSLRIDGLHRNKEPSKIRIVLGDMLLPAYVCQLQRSDKRLIPIGDLPPLHGSGNSHAGQAQLQLHVFSEFSNQSDRLAKSGSVLITPDMWERMALASGLSPEKIRDVIAHWCQPDLFNCFLEKQGDEYKLASYYERAQKFLEIQGQGRIDNSEKGKRSAEKRRELGKKS